MKSKILLIVCIAILSLFIFMTQPSTIFYSFGDEEIKHAEPLQSIPKKFQINDQPDHLLWFIQVNKIF